MRLEARGVGGRWGASTFTGWVEKEEYMKETKEGQ